MKKLITVFVCLVAFMSIEAQAKVSGKIALGEQWGIGWTPNGEMSRGISNTGLSFGIGAPIKDTGFSWSTDLMVSVPNTVFEPAPRLTAGIAYSWKETRMSLGFSIMDQINPGYGSKVMANTFGFTLAPSVAITDSISFGIGVGYRLTHQGSTVLKHGLAIGPTFTFKLPW